METPSIFLLLIGSGLVFFGKLVEHFVSEVLGVGFEHLGIGIVAVTLIKVTIEKATEREFLGTLRKDVKSQIASLVTSILTRNNWIRDNPSLIEQLQDSVLTPNFIRPTYKLTLKLEPLENLSDFFKVSVSTEYSVKNISEKTLPYQVHSWLDNLIKLKGYTANSKLGFTHIQIDDQPPFDISSLENTGKLTRVGKRVILLDDHVIHLEYETRPIQPNETLNILIDGSQIMRTEDHFVWNLTTITERLEISIQLLGDLDFSKLDVSPRELHPISHKDFINSMSPKTPTRWDLKIDQVILPYQGVEVRWAFKNGHVKS